MTLIEIIPFILLIWILCSLFYLWGHQNALKEYKKETFCYYEKGVEIGMKAVREKWGKKHE